jgi:hypothetical protein
MTTAARRQNIRANPKPVAAANATRPKKQILPLGILLSPVIGLAPAHGNPIQRAPFRFHPDVRVAGEHGA